MVHYKYHACVLQEEGYERCGSQAKEPTTTEDKKTLDYQRVESCQTGD